jgi:protein N-terminal glutamine amidohydrolase
MPIHHPLPYQAFWCEENIWHLADHPAPGPGERRVLVITGAEAEVACWNQRAGRPGQPIAWDYHVVLAVRGDVWQVWDLDNRLGAPLPAADWLRGTFPCPERVRTEFQPRVAMFAAEDWRRGFGSDRAHMRHVDGGWQQPPPSWPMISGREFTLADALALARAGLDLDGLAAALA